MKGIRPLGAAFLAVCSVAAALPADAAKYAVTVKREDSQLYSLDYGKAFAITKYCYQYVYHQKAVVDWSGNFGSIIFEGGDKCDLKALLVQSELSKGTYRLLASSEMQGFVIDETQGVYLRAPYCIELAFYEEATLFWEVFGGKLRFKNGNTCDVESVWVKAN